MFTSTDEFIQEVYLSALLLEILKSREWQRDKSVVFGKGRYCNDHRTLKRKIAQS